MAQVFLSLILFYTYRFLERQMGSRKYGAFLFLSWFFVTISLVIIMVIANAMKSTFTPTCGPFFFVFAQLAFFYRMCLFFLNIIFIIIMLIASFYMNRIYPQNRTTTICIIRRCYFFRKKLDLFISSSIILL
jgi:hypothetical protein